jgi:hypothetical protein
MKLLGKMKVSDEFFNEILEETKEELQHNSEEFLK